jgi:hypothetical protein
LMVFPASDPGYVIVPPTEPDAGNTINLTRPDALTSSLGTDKVDTVIYGGTGTVTLPANIENMRLTGSEGYAVGNATSNRIEVTGTGNHTIDGGAGIDAVVLPGSRADYSFQIADGKLIVKGPTGTQTLSNVEVLVTQDGTIDLRDIGNVQQDVARGYEAIFGKAPAPTAIAQAMASLADGSQTLYGYFASQIAETTSTTIAALVVADFVSGITPTSSHLSALVAHTESQFAYYSQMGVMRPELGPYEALGRGFSQTAGFQDKYGGGTDTEFIKTAYKDVFGREATDAQLLHFETQVAFYEQLYVMANIAGASADAWSRGAVLGQMLGHSALDEPEDSPHLAHATAFLLDAVDGVGTYGQPLDMRQTFDLV